MSLSAEREFGKNKAASGILGPFTACSQPGGIPTARAPPPPPPTTTTTEAPAPAHSLPRAPGGLPQRTPGPGGGGVRMPSVIKKIKKMTEVCACVGVRGALVSVRAASVRRVPCVCLIPCAVRAPSACAVHLDDGLTIDGR